MIIQFQHQPHKTSMKERVLDIALIDRQESSQQQEWKNEDIVGFNAESLQPWPLTATTQ